MTLPHVQLIIIIIIVMIQVAVLNWFSWNSHGWCESTHKWTLFLLEIIGPIKSLIKGGGGNVAPKLFCHPTFYSLKNSHARKTFFTVILKILFCFFFLKCYMKNIQNLISYKKVYIDFCRQTRPYFENCISLVAKCYQ